MPNYWLWPVAADLALVMLAAVLAALFRTMPFRSVLVRMQ